MHGLRLLVLVSVTILGAAFGLLTSQAERAGAHHIAGVSAGGQHTCALTTNGGVQCWGRNQFGQLGDGNVDYSGAYTPVNVVGLSSGVTSVASGAVHTCALTTAGAVLCWGSGFPAVPTPVAGLESGVTQISAGFNLTCAVTGAGGVKCWGTPFGLTPVDIPGVSSDVIAVGAGFKFGCALTTGGGVKCWGSNSQGELGDGTTNGSSSAVDVLGLSNGIQSIAVGESVSCALTTGGGVKCWGANWNGELGIGNTNFVLGPQDVVGLASGVQAISAENGLHVCALLTAGGVKCWGSNFNGQVDGIGTIGHLTPVDAPVRGNVVQVSAGGYHTCALLDNGAVTCWGGDDYGQTGDTDGDGCTDFAEHASNPMLGGLRDHEDYWDFFDTPSLANSRDAIISVGDIGGIVDRFGTSGDPSGDPRAAPPASGYHTAFDRGGQTGPNAWNQAPANGNVSVGDIGVLVAQFGHRCA